MDSPTKIRKEIYEFVKTKGAILADEDLKFLSAKIKLHSDCREYNLKEIARRVDYTKIKIAEYLKKANKMNTKTAQIHGNVEALNLVSNWLNSDAE